MDLVKIVRAAEPFVPPILWTQLYRLQALGQLVRGEVRRELRRNAGLRDRLRGRRAFVVGNGPSLNRLDLGRLRDEAVFTVNTFYRYAAKHGIVPVAHAFIDPLYFAPEAIHEPIEFAADHDPRTLCFLPMEQRSLFRERLPDAHYLLMAGRLEVNANQDLSRPIGGLQTVTLAALLIALYMGCSPIYLIGCDLDLLQHVVGVSPLRVARTHFYDTDGTDVIEVPGFDYGGYGHAIWRMIDGYRLIGQRLRPDQRVYNAGAGGMLDVFERVEFDSLFRG
jgi:hypothetical protein